MRIPQNARKGADERRDAFYPLIVMGSAFPVNPVACLMCSGLLFDI